MEISYISSHFDANMLPRINKEVAFIGRSNVGKSSLINKLINRDICFVSKKPGKTITINVFADKNLKMGFIDLPGYGFAKISAEIQNKWRTLIPQYLQNRQSLAMIYVLIDIRRGFMDSDLDALDLISSFNKKVSIVFTKTDKLRENELILARAETTNIANQLKLIDNIYYISNKDSTNKEILYLKRNIEEILK